MKLKFGSVCGRGIIDVFILITQLKRFFPLHSTSRDTGQVERMLDFLPAHPQLWVATVGYYFLLLKMERTMKHLIFTAATKLGQGYVFTRVCDYVNGGGLPPLHAGIHPIGTRPPAPRTRGRHPLGPKAGTPTPRSRHPPSAVHSGRYGQQAGDTHPTGMQPCYRQYTNVRRK